MDTSKTIAGAFDEAALHLYTAIGHLGTSIYYDRVKLTLGRIIDNGEADNEEDAIALAAERVLPGVDKTREEILAAYRAQKQDSEDMVANEENRNAFFSK